MRASPSLHWTILWIWLLVYPSQTPAANCQTLFIYLSSWVQRGILSDVKKENPDLDDYYSPEIQRAANNLYRKFNKRWDSNLPASSSALQKLQPFLDIEKAIEDSQNQKSEYSPETLGKQSLKWNRDTEFFSFFYTQLPRFGNNSPKILEWLRKHHPAFSGIYLQTDSPGFAVTFSLEKETHNPKITDWYRPIFKNEEEWLKLSKEERQKLLWKAFSIKPTSLKPSYLGNAKKERPMGLYNRRGFNYDKPPIEASHRNFDLRLADTHQKIDEMSEKLGESSAFHLHEVFAFRNNPISFIKFKRWWKKVNDYNYLHGLEEGMHPTRLTKLPENKNLPLDPNSINLSDHKYNGVGLRSGIYGPPPDKDHILLGIELRDTNKTISGLKNFSTRIAQSLGDQIWDKGLGYEKNPLPLTYTGEIINIFGKKLAELGASVEEINIALNTEPLLTIPINEFESIAGTTEMKDSFIKAREAYLNDLLNTLKERRRFIERNESVDEDILRMAFRTALTEWAQATKPSKLYDDF